MHSHQAVTLVRNNSKYYKIHFRYAFTYHLSVCVKKQWDLFLFPTAHEMVSGINGHMFFEYPALEPPLSTDDAASCLPTLVQGVILAIQSLHAAKYAHLDIRLPNICYKPDGTATPVLIDLDNYRKSSFSANSILRRNSVMYNYQSTRLLPGGRTYRVP